MRVRAVSMIGLCILALHAAWASNVAGGNGDHHDVSLKKHGETYAFDNGNLQVELDGPNATITSMRYRGTDFINRVGNHEQIYWSMDGGSSYQNPRGAVCAVKADTPDMADVGCKEKYNGSQPHAFDIEIHYVLRRGATGLYVYAILSHPADYPATSVGEWRIVWQTPQQGDKWLLEKIYVDKTRHWVMPTPAELAQRIPTPIKEISFFRSGPWKDQGESKYTYSATYEDIHCFGFASDIHRLGAWTVLGSYEYYNDGPRKQDLTGLDAGMTHHFGRNHYDGTGISVAAGENWSKIFGPFLLYLNADGDGDTLWRDAQQQADAERAAWPYAWLKDVPEYPSEAERGTIQGKFAISDPLKPQQTGNTAWIGLTQPPQDGDFQSESKNYQYWSRVGADGRFTIPHVRPGDYTLYAFVNGETGQYVQQHVTVTAGKTLELPPITWVIPRKGTWLAWEIGTPDRDTLEFRHGNNYFMPYLYKGFPLEFPNPLVYTVGSSRPEKDWNYAQSGYHPQNAQPQPWPWQIRFKLASIPPSGTANLILAIAGSNRAKVHVSVNGGATTYDFVPLMNAGNALLRQGSHAKYSVQEVPIPLSSLHAGDNVIELTETNFKEDAAYVSYDYLALEMPGPVPAK